MSNEPKSNPNTPDVEKLQTAFQHINDLGVTAFDLYAFAIAMDAITESEDLNENPLQVVRDWQDQDDDNSTSKDLFNLAADTVTAIQAYNKRIGL